MDQTCRGASLIGIGCAEMGSIALLVQLVNRIMANNTGVRFFIFTSFFFLVYTPSRTQNGKCRS